MEHTGTKTAADDFVDAEFTEEKGLEVRKSQAQISIRHEMSPESLQAEIDRQSQMQQIMTRYVKDQMVKDHHYYSFNEGGKPALTKDGAFRICSLLKCFPGLVDVEIIREDSGHFTVVSFARILNQDAVEIASSRGSASTRESKYAYRWVFDNQVPNDVDRKTLKSRSGEKNGRKWSQYQLPNPDLADLENTIIKMSEKRATVGAVNKLPLVSELFAADPDDHTPESKGRQASRSVPSQRPAQQTAPSPAEQGSSQADDPEESAGVLREIGDLLKVKCGDGETVDEEAANAALKGRNLAVMTVDALRKFRDDLAVM